MTELYLCDELASLTEPVEAFVYEQTLSLFVYTHSVIGLTFYSVLARFDGHNEVS
jgi:hypothetical protein